MPGVLSIKFDARGHQLTDREVSFVPHHVSPSGAKTLLKLVFTGLSTVDGATSLGLLGTETGTVPCEDFLGREDTENESNGGKPVEFRNVPIEEAKALMVAGAKENARKQSP